MTFRAFTYACEVLRLQQQERFHVETVPAVPEPTPAELRERNADAMKQLGMMMGGVQKAPRVR